MNPLLPPITWNVAVENDRREPMADDEHSFFDPGTSVWGQRELPSAA